MVGFLTEKGGDVEKKILEKLSTQSTALYISLYLLLLLNIIKLKNIKR